MEKERYIYTKIDGYYWIKDTKTNENYCANKTIVKLLNQQDKRIKELEEENNFLEKRNEKLIIDCQDFCLERNDIFEENKQLKEKYDNLYKCYQKTSQEDLKDKYDLAEKNEKLKIENGNLKEKISTQLQNNADNVDFMENQRKEIEQLKQSQNEKAIEVLTDILVNLCSKYSTIFGNHDEPIRVLDVEQISDFVNNQIKELRNEK